MNSCFLTMGKKNTESRIYEKTPFLLTGLVPCCVTKPHVFRNTIYCHSTYSLIPSLGDILKYSIFQGEYFQNFHIFIAGGEGMAISPEIWDCFIPSFQDTVNVVLLYCACPKSLSFLFSKLVKHVVFSDERWMAVSFGGSLPVGFSFIRCYSSLYADLHKGRNIQCSPKPNLLLNPLPYKTLGSESEKKNPFPHFSF